MAVRIFVLCSALCSFSRDCLWTTMLRPELNCEFCYCVCFWLKQVYHLRLRGLDCVERALYHWNVWSVTDWHVQLSGCQHKKTELHYDTWTNQHVQFYTPDCSCKQNLIFSPTLILQSKLTARKLRAVHVVPKRVLKEDKSTAGNEVGFTLPSTPSLLPTFLLSFLFSLLSQARSLMESGKVKSSCSCVHAVHKLLPHLQ